MILFVACNFFSVSEKISPLADVILTQKMCNILHFYIFLWVLTSFPFF